QSMGESESTTFVLPQELTSMLGRYGKHLTGSDIKEDGNVLDSLDFDEETRELIGLDNIDEIIGEIDEEAELDIEEMEQEAEALKSGNTSANIQEPDEVVAEADEHDETSTGDSTLSTASKESELETN